MKFYLLKQKKNIVDQRAYQYINVSISECGLMLNPHLHSPQASQKCRLLA